MLDTATCDTNHSRTGRLTAPREPLVLRAIGPDGGEQFVHLAGAKSTLGAANVCTVRVPFAGVRPIHCSILRGPRTTVVHCWADGTLLNGEPFADSLLHVGDRLAIGPIEFEIVSGVERRAEFVEPANSPTAQQRIEKLEHSRQAERRRTRRLLAELRIARWNVSRSQADAARRGDVVQSLEAKSTALEAAVAELTAHLSHDQQEIAQAREGWLTEQADLSGELEASRRQVEHEQHRHSVEQLQFSLHLQEWESAQQQLQTRLAEATAAAQQVDALRQRAADAEAAVAFAHGQLAAVEARAQQLAGERDLERNARELLASDADAVRRQLADAQSVAARLEVKLAAAQTAAARFESQVVEANSFVARLETEIADAQRQIESRPSPEAEAATPAVDPMELETLRQQVLELELRADDTLRRLEATEAERSRLQSLVEQSAARDRKFAEFEICAREAAEEAAGLRQQADELRGKITELERERSERERAEQETAERERPCSEPETTPDFPPVDPVVEIATEPVVAESTADQPIADAPVSAADVLARLGRAGIWRDEDAVAEPSTLPSMVPETPPTPTETSFAAPATLETSTPPSWSSRDVIPPRERVANDDESIEDYMARLLKRVRGDQAARSYKDSGAKADSDAADRLDTTAEPTAVSQAFAPPAPVPPEPVAEPIQYTPRAVPPQFKANLAAMREIANSSARSAIETHHKTSGRQTSKFKLFSALGITAASTIALAVSDDKLWQYAGIGIGYITAAYWLAQSLRGYFIPQRLRECSSSQSARVATVAQARDEATE